MQNFLRPWLHPVTEKDQRRIVGETEDSAFQRPSLLQHPGKWPNAENFVRLDRCLKIKFVSFLDAHGILPRLPASPFAPALPAVPPPLSCSLQILLGTLLKLTHHAELKALSRVERISVSDTRFW